ncbi:MAG: tRNA pseudouridine(38-40) synthase TruA [Oligoflexia bacterium]|nr:tRNA pseudouridine(38-40) synthase TruA [Oligoflexia bacterium]
MAEPGDRTTWRIDLAWDGRAYLGWQRQPQGPTIQGQVEDALAAVLGGERVCVRASGRTDAGVHALHQVASFSTRVSRSAVSVVGGLNFFLPPDIACLAARQVSEGFDPRLFTTGKLYRYRVLNRRVRCPFRHARVWHIERPLDVVAMDAAAEVLVGEHDFTSFRAHGCSARSPVRRLSGARVLAVDDEVHFEYQGHGFLRHQARVMTGTLVEVGRGRWPPHYVAEVLAAHDRSLAGATAPAQGLCLVHVTCRDTPRPS